MLNKKIYLVAFLAAIFLSLMGCARTSTLYSNTFVKPSVSITKLNVVYIESDLFTSGGQARTEFYDVGYTDLPELLRERTPIVLGLNNIGAEYASFKSQGVGQNKKVESIKWEEGSEDAMLLTLQIIDGQVVSGPRTPRTTTLNMQANLIDPKTKLRQWTGQFRNTFIFSLVSKSGFDNQLVDNLLKNILEQMSRDGMIALKEHEAVIPVAKEEPTKKD